MSAEVKSAIASMLAELVPLVPFPQPPFGFGSDISGDSDLDENMNEVSGNSILVLAQAIVRRLDCPRGQNPDDPHYGIGLRQMLNVGITTEQINSLGGQIKLELQKDDRIEAVIVSVIPFDSGRTLSVSLFVTPADPSLTAFTLTLNASSAAILIDAIRASR